MMMNDGMMTEAICATLGQCENISDDARFGRKSSKKISSDTVRAVFRLIFDRFEHLLRQIRQKIVPDAME